MRRLRWPLLIAGLLPLLGSPLRATGQPIESGGTRAMASRPLLVGDLPVGTVTVRVGRGSLTNAAIGVEVTASVTPPGGRTSTRVERTRDDGRATFSGLPPEAQFRAQAVVDGQPLETATFAIPQSGGARLMLVSSGAEPPEAVPAGHGPPPQLPPEHPRPSDMPPGPAGSPPVLAAEPAAPLQKTSDTSVLRIGSASRFLIDLREETLAVVENLIIENTSDRLFDPGTGGLHIPLPAEAVGSANIEGGTRLDTRQPTDLVLHDAIPPTKDLAKALQARFGFYLPSKGAAQARLRQPMPLGIETPVVLSPESAHLALAGPGLHVLPAQQDDRNLTINMCQLASVPRGGAFELAISGLPTRNNTGRRVAGVLAAALALTAVAGWRRPRSRQRAEQEAQRQARFTELVELERSRQKDPDAAHLAARRAQLIASITELDRALEDGHLARK